MNAAEQLAAAAEAYVDTCPRCRKAPAGHPKPGGLCDSCYADIVQRAVSAIRAAVYAAQQPPERDCCEACGCLVFPDEHCPGCKARRQQNNHVQEPAA